MRYSLFVVLGIIYYFNRTYYISIVINDEFLYWLLEPALFVYACIIKLYIVYSRTPPCGGEEMSSRFIDMAAAVYVVVNLERTRTVVAVAPGTMAGSAPGYQNSKRGLRRQTLLYDILFIYYFFVLLLFFTLDEFEYISLYAFNSVNDFLFRYRYIVYYSFLTDFFILYVFFCYERKNIFFKKRSILYIDT